MAMTQAETITLGQAYADVGRIVADFERDGQAPRARAALERVAESLPPDVRALLAELHGLHEEEVRLDAEIASRQKERDDLVLRHRLANRPSRARRPYDRD